MIYIQTSDKTVTACGYELLRKWQPNKQGGRSEKREKAKAKAAEGGADDTAKVDEDEETENGNEWLARITGWCVVRSTGKIRSFSLVENEDVAGAKGVRGESSLSFGDLQDLYTNARHFPSQILLALSNNSLETHMVPTPPLPGLISSKSKLKAPVARSSRAESMFLTCTATVPTLGVSASAVMIRSLQAQVTVVSRFGIEDSACIRTMERGNGA